jgi:DNA-binding response OmpR family regulator
LPPRVARARGADSASRFLSPPNCNQSSNNERELMKPTTILVTDDESSIRLMLRTALESEGYDVEEAADGQEALVAINRRVPDLMVLDLNMPRLDGMAVLEQMKSMAASAKPRVIVLTAYGSIPTAVRATRLGATDFLEKPVMPSDLREAVRSVLLEPGLESPPVVSDVPERYHEVLDRVRKLLRLADYSTAETMLMKDEAPEVEFFEVPEPADS